MLQACQFTQYTACKVQWTVHYQGALTLIEVAAAHSAVKKSIDLTHQQGCPNQFERTSTCLVLQPCHMQASSHSLERRIDNHGTEDCAAA